MPCYNETKVAGPGHGLIGGCPLIERNSHTTRLAVALVCLLLVSSCTRSSKRDEVVSDRGYAISADDAFYVIVEAPHEDAWMNVLLALEDLGWPIDTETDASGFITTEVVEMGTNRDRYACREWPGSRTRVDLLRSKLVVHIESVSDTVTRVRAFTNIEGRYVYWNSLGEERVGGWWQCTSTGEIESELFDAFLTRFEPIWYDRSVFRPGARGAR